MTSEDKSPRHHILETRDSRVQYLKCGEGPLLVMLHGFPATSRNWERLSKRMAENFTVICPDLKGYGHSARPKGVEAYTSADVAQDIVDLVRSFGSEKVRLVGHDWGGAIAYHLAAHHGELFSHLCVMNCPHPALLVKHLKTNLKQLRRSWYILFFQLPWLPELLIRSNVDGFIKACFRPQRAFTDEERAHYKEALLQRGALTAAINYYRAAGRAVFGRPPRWPKIGCPFQLIWGVKDAALGVETTDNMERFFELPIRREFFPNSGHWVHNQEPEEVAELLARFLVT